MSLSPFLKISQNLEMIIRITVSKDWELVITMVEEKRRCMNITLNATLVSRRITHVVFRR